MDWIIIVVTIASALLSQPRHPLQPFGFYHFKHEVSTATHPGAGAMLGVRLDASNCMCVRVVGQHVWIGAGGYILAQR